MFLLYGIETERNRVGTCNKNNCYFNVSDETMDEVVALQCSGLNVRKSQGHRRL